MCSCQAPTKLTAKQVLILYVMNPPVKDGIQGAFLVAVVITGLVFGVLSVIFPEITEGLGCLLGGFCLSMWLLVLKPGGLLVSTSSKAIFISVLCVAVYAASFSHHTRTVALIASTSFAGATAVVLGVDCFSRAGLKEFWLYIWAVNENIFPVDVETYPHTRGIRAELAAAIFIFVLGLVSQSKMWKIVRERRRRKSAEQKERERDASALEEAVGRKVEDDINRERAEWEAIYGGRSPSDETKCGSSGDGGAESEGKLGATVVELRDLEGQTPDVTDGGDVLRRPSRRGGVYTTGGPQAEATRSNLPTVRGISDGAEGVDGDGLPRLWSLDRTAPGVKPTQPGTASALLSASEDSPGHGVNGGGSARSSVYAPALPITPLPFNVPDSAQTPDGDDGRSSVSACAESTPGLVQILEHPVLSRLRRSSAGYSHVLSSSEEALLPPGRNDKEDSSVAATVDEGSDLDSTPPPPLPPLPHASGGASAPHPHVRPSLEPAAAVPLPSSPTPGSEFDRQEDSLPGSNRRSVLDGPTLLVPPNGADGLDAASTPEDAETKRARSIRLSKAVLNDQSPNQVSRVLSCYRTNEWAKHLSLADTPDLDNLEPTEDAVVVIESSADKPGDAGGHSARAEPEPPADTVTRDSSLASPQKDVPLPAVVGSRAATSSKEGLPLPQTASQAPAASNRPRAQSVASLEDRGSSSTSSGSVRSLVMADAPGAPPVRSSSNPAVRQSANSSATRLSVYRNLSRSSQVSLPAENTLISQRESLIHNKYGMRSSSQLTPVPELDAHVAPSSSTPVLDARVPAAGGDDPSANERTEVVQRQLSQQRERFNPYQPRRYSDLEGQRRNAMLAQWRQSLREHSINSRQPDQQLEEARASDLHVDRQHKLHNTRHQSVAVAGADVLVDERMRRPDMLELHRLAMKRMQSAARVHSGARF